MGRRSGGPRIYLRGEIYWCRFTVGKRRWFVSTGERDAGAAEEAAAKLHAEAVLETKPPTPVVGRPSKRPGEPLDVLAARYLTWAGGQGKDERYVKDQRYHFHAHFQTRWDRLRQINSASIAKYQTERRRSVGTVTLYKELVTLSRFLKWCKREHLIEAIPDFERPQQETDYQVPNLSPKDVQAILVRLPDRKAHPKRHPVREFCTFMWSMALRFTEASSIRWADVDLDTRRLTVRKTLDKAGRTWVLPLTDEAANLLRSEQGRARRPDGKIFGIKSVRATLDKICTDPHVTPHHFRHARISEWAANTRDLASVQFMARHMSIATTALYVRSRTEQAERMLQEIVRHKRRGK